LEGALKLISPIGENLTVDKAVLSSWWASSIGEIIQVLGTDPENGLTVRRVEENRAAFGSNVLEELKPTSTWSLVLEGIRQPMMVLLLSIAVASFVFREPVEGLVMLLVVVAYVAVEFISARGLKKTMVVPHFPAKTSPSRSKHFIRLLDQALLACSNLPWLAA